MKESPAVDKTKNNGTTKEPGKGFSSAFRTIMARKLKASSNTSQPQQAMLYEQPDVYESIKRKNVEKLYGRKIAAEKKKLREDRHTLPSVFDRTREKRLKSIATKGVVKLFNTIMAHRR